MGKDGLIVLLGFLFVLSLMLDWISLRDELEDMRDDDHENTKNDIRRQQDIDDDWTG